MSLCAILRAQDKKVVKTAADLPRFSYPLSQPPSAFLLADDVTLNAFARKVDADVQLVFEEYTIADRETMRELLKAHGTVQMLLGDYAGAAETAKRGRDLEDKPSAKLTVAYLKESWPRHRLPLRGPAAPLSSGITAIRSTLFHGLLLKGR